MHVKIRKFGNSTGVTVPASLVQELALQVNQDVELEKTADGNILLKPQKKKRYTLEELLAQCDITAWDAVPTIGKEKI